MLKKLLAGMRRTRTGSKNAVTREYFHGGVDGLRVGDTILPRNQMDDWRTVIVSYSRAIPEEAKSSPDHVSITQDFDMAKSYAGEYQSAKGIRAPGRVYAVEPIGIVEEDPDWPHTFPEIARCDQGARILAVLEQVQPVNDRRETTRLQAGFYRYSATGTPFYDEHGYVIFTPELGDLGYTPESLRGLGPWPPTEDVIP